MLKVQILEGESNEIQDLKRLVNEQLLTIKTKMDDLESVLTAWKDDIERNLLSGKRNRPTDSVTKEEEEIQREQVEIINSRIKNICLERSKYY